MIGTFDFGVIWRSLPYLFEQGMVFTLTLTAIATVFGLTLGTILAVMRLSSRPILSVVAASYVNLIRALPLVLVIFLFYFLAPYVGQWVHAGVGQRVAELEGCGQERFEQRRLLPARPCGRPPGPTGSDHQGGWCPSRHIRGGPRAATCRSWSSSPLWRAAAVPRRSSSGPQRKNPRQAGG